MPPLTPLFKRPFAKANRSGTHIAIDVPIHPVIIPRPISRQQSAFIKIDDVGLEAETDMRLGSRSLNLMIARESEDIVLNQIRFAVMLMKASVRGAINDIALHQDTAAPFIKINPPATILNSGDIMPEIVYNLRSRLLPNV